ncbi:hypothetical protein DEU34_0611 [Microbacterium sp. AG1240]|uniref:hypothetical protein n=1 Tax=Microbacterium sp. AG1240 TaxID=2183992 RepID=UPI000EB546FA|nr:hypothetical protein [Microbacterium sp. AG1240]RKT36104.1 hypothetical protein DEU34_0611 [Microbacterium sp. AG1240]
MSTVEVDRPGAGVVWARVEDGFHVGSRGGEFLGYIDRQRDGRWLACDLFSREVGLFADLTAAMKALTEVEASERSRRR